MLQHIRRLAQLTQRLGTVAKPTGQGCSAGSSVCQQPLPAAPSFISSCSISAASPAAQPGEATEGLEQIRARIFGTHIGNGLRSGRKVLQKKLVGDVVSNYYMQPIQKLDPLFLDENAERKRAKLDKLRRRGKGPPKKGHGKRSKK